MSRKFSNFEVSNKKILSPMPSDKGTNIFSEIGKFFKENDATSAMNAIMDMTKVLRLSEKRLFGSESKCNCKLTQLQVLGLLMLFPCFMIRNAYNYSKSSLSGLFDCKKDVFYRFLSNESYDWRKILATVTIQLWNKVQEKRTSDSTEPVCLMVDDTDYPKRGIQTELIGKIYSHVTHSMMLGFKGLFIGITDGMSQMLLDFALVGEAGKKGNHGLKQKQLGARFSKEHDKGSHTAKRIKEYDQSKITLMIENLGLGKYQMRNFSSQIAMTAITAMQYNLLSTARRFSDYETVGGLFKDATMSSVELTLTERIWDMILEIVREIAECFNIEDEDIFDTLLNRSDKLSHFVEIYQLKQAS